MTDLAVRLLFEATNTTLTIDNLPLDDVGRVLATLAENGFEVEINVSRRRENP